MPPTPPPPPSSFWKMAEATGADRQDSVNGHDLTNNNNVSQMAGKVGYASAFARPSSRYLSSVHGSLSPGNASYSFAGWVRFDAALGVGTNQIVFGKDAAGNREYLLMISNLAFKRLEFIPFDNGGGQQSVIAATPGDLVDDTWYFFACGFDKAAGKGWISIDNSARYESSFPNHAGAGTAEFDVGRRSGFGVPAYLTGAVDALGYWSGHSLTADEIDYLWNGGAGTEYPPPTTPAPTTPSPTTPSPTTPAPTTPVPTTASPTTPAPTTPAPTTTAPTTPVPTTAGPTTPAPTTAPPTTAAPTTVPPAPPAGFFSMLGRRFGGSGIPPGVTTVPPSTIPPGDLQQIMLGRIMKTRTRELVARVWVADADGWIDEAEEFRPALCSASLYDENGLVRTVAGIPDPAGGCYARFEIPQIELKPGECYVLRVSLFRSTGTPLGTRDFFLGTT